MDKKIFIYDTTLRDGSQRRGISLSIQDKLRITEFLDDFGVDYIEGGWPGSNPKDYEYFKQVQSLKLKNAKITAFGATRRAKLKADEDPNLQALLDAETPVVALVGKTSPFQVKEVLRTELETNLEMISDSVKYLKDKGKEVIYDAEHFFDGYLEDPEYSLSTLKAAAQAGADCLCLCDTNGGSLPGHIKEATLKVKESFSCQVGVHCHNDSGLGVANSLAAVEAGALQIQGTVNGYGERCGNADLISVIPNLQLKMGYNIVSGHTLSGLTDLSRKVSGIVNLNPDKGAPFVGENAFAHKGGIHVAAIERNTKAYEHISPESVGNSRNIVISELSGRKNIAVRADELGIKLEVSETEILAQIKELESKGFQFENAEGSFELMLRKNRAGYEAPFEIIDLMEISEQRAEKQLSANAMVKIRVGDKVFHTASDGDGPVHAIDGAIRKALLPVYPELDKVHLSDYKVRILNPQNATAATTRVSLEAQADGERWVTVGCSDNLIEASFHALAESYELYFVRLHQK